VTISRRKRSHGWSAPYAADLVDAALHVEVRLTDIVVLAVEDLLEAADRLRDGNVLARRAGEDFRNVERLREEALDLASAEHGELVFRRKLVHARIAMMSCRSL
jgi:hypothetical protein